ncbi:ketoacyl-ACP synthase III [bacterium]|nr:ketoacyl-ACP synthase III [bacterium]
MSSAVRHTSADVPRTRSKTADGKALLAPTHTLTGFQVLATGSYVPDPVVTNADLKERNGFDDSWIIQRTGIKERRQVPVEMATSDLCYEAARRCIDSAGIDKDQIDFLILATFSPDMAFPATACIVQDKLEIRCGAFDLQAACAGFMYALTVGANFVKAGTSKLCLVIGGDANSRITNPRDQKTYPLFGDGAGAVLIGPGDPTQGFLSFHLGSDGSGGELLSRPAGGSRRPVTADDIDAGHQFLQMNGPAVFTWAVNTVTESIQEVLAHANLTPADIDYFIPHQANIRIVNAVSDVLGIPRDRVFTNLHRYGNTSAGSIPLALDEAIHEMNIPRGSKILLSGFGSGLTFGTAVLRW